MTIQFLNQQRDRAYEGSKAKGFWDKPRDPFEAIALTIGELYEALEAHRHNKISNNVEFTALTTGPQTMAAEQYATLFKEKVKDTMGDELADAFIRLMDFCGGFKIEFRRYQGMDSLYDPVPKWPENFGHGILIIDRLIQEALYYMTGKPEDMHTVFHRWTDAASAIVYFCRFHDIDLEQHIQWKLQFNATRAYLHGGNY